MYLKNKTKYILSAGTPPYVCMSLETSYYSAWTWCVAQANLRLSVCCLILPAAEATGVCVAVPGSKNQSHFKNTDRQQRKQMGKARVRGERQSELQSRASGQGQRGTLHVRKGQLIQETIRALNACTPDLVLGERSDASAIDGEPASWHT